MRQCLQENTCNSVLSVLFCVPAGAKKDETLEIPLLEEILQMRVDPYSSEPEELDAYVFFVDRILGAAVGHRAWDRKKKSFRTISSKREGVSASDEAFALVVLVNQWDAVFQVRGKTKYTGKHVQGTSNRKCDGWSEAGIIKYNELLTKVKENRSKEFAERAEEEIRRRLKEKYYPVEQYGMLHSPREIKKRKRQRDGQEENVDIDQRPIALMDMFDSDEEEVDNMYEA